MGQLSGHHGVKQDRLCTCSIRARAAWLGMPREISLSNLPARRRAASSDSGLLVAPAQPFSSSTLVCYKTVYDRLYP